MNREQMEILDLMHKLPDKELCQMIGFLGNIVSERLRIETYLKEKYFEGIISPTDNEEDEEIS